MTQSEIECNRVDSVNLTVAKLIASMVVDHQCLQCFFIDEILGRVSSTTA